MFCFFFSNATHYSEQSCGDVDQSLLERLCSESSGDIRCAVNSLQFLLFPGQESVQLHHFTNTYIPTYTPISYPSVPSVGCDLMIEELAIHVQTLTSSQCWSFEQNTGPLTAPSGPDSITAATHWCVSEWSDERLLKKRFEVRWRYWLALYKCRHLSSTI